MSDIIIMHRRPSRKSGRVEHALLRLQRKELIGTICEGPHAHDCEAQLLCQVQHLRHLGDQQATDLNQCCQASMMLARNPPASVPGNENYHLLPSVACNNCLILCM